MKSDSHANVTLLSGFLLVNETHAMQLEHPNSVRMTLMRWFFLANQKHLLVGAVPQLMQLTH